MSTRSAIEWTEVTWNPVTGCTKISHGCRFCYAERMSKRLLAMGVEKYKEGFSPAVHEVALGEPLRWRRPRLVFVNSMSDLFHKRVPATFIEAVFDVMNRASQQYLPGTHQTAGSGRAARPQATLDTEHLARHQHRVRKVAGSAGAAQRHRRPYEISVSRTLARTAAWHPPARDRLGHCRWRIRTRRTADGHRLGAGHPQQLPAKRSTVFLQAMGRCIQEEDGPDTG